MNSNSQETLRRIEQNDAQFTELQIGYPYLDGGFKSRDASDYLRLGAAIGNNTHLKELVVALDIDYDDDNSLDATNTEFFNGLKRNSSIKILTLDCYGHILIGGAEHEILKSFQKINNNLTRLCINKAVLDNGGDRVIAEALRWCRNIKTINIGDNRITDEHLLPIVEAIRGECHSSLEQLYLFAGLFANTIGNAGCHALATLLADTNCNLKLLNLDTNRIGTEGATAIANSLANNTTLKKLDLNENPFDPSVLAYFCRALCNTSSVNDTYRSNHTLTELVLSDEQQGQHADHLSSIMRLNKGRNKSHVAIKKILMYHPNIDMEPLFEWDADGDADGEQSLKALPHVIDWFGRAEEAVADEVG